MPKFHLTMALATSSVLALAASARAQEATTTVVPEVVVTGSRLPTGFSTPTPVTVLGSDQMAQRAPATIADALYELPSFRPAGGSTQQQGNTFAPAQAPLELRGLGAQRTLVLIDGRRTVGTQVNGTFDVSMIPTNLVDRTEVVTGGASAVYGSDAVAGVVNIILNSKLEGFKANVQYGRAEAGDNKEYLAGAAFGHAFADGRIHLIVGGDYAQEKGIDSMYSRDWGREEAGFLPLLATRQAGLPANVITSHVVTALAPGSDITGCRNAAGALIANCSLIDTAFRDNGVPYHFVYAPLRGAALMGGAVSDNFGLTSQRNSALRVPFDRYGILARATFDVTADLTAYAEFNAGRLEVDTKAIDYTSTTGNNQITIRQDNPFLPQAIRDVMAAQGISQILMNRYNLNIGALHTLNSNQIDRYTVGAKGRLFGDWTWDAYYTYGLGRQRFLVENATKPANFAAALYAVRDPTTGQVVCGPNASNPNFVNPTFGASKVQAGCAPFNPFGPNEASAASIAYITATQSILYRMTQEVEAANVQGKPFSTWAGEVAVGFGVEHRKETIQQGGGPESQAALFFFQNTPKASGAVEVTEGYVETEVPLLKDAPFAHSIAVNAAARRTDYSSSGGVTTWKLGGTWEVNDAVRFRVTRSRDIRAPGINELYLVGAVGGGVLTNPLTGVSAFTANQASGNPNLRPEVAKTWTAGVVVQPTWEALRGLRVSVDYFNIDIRDVITTLTQADVLRRFYLEGRQEYAQFITFAPGTATGFTQVSTPFINAQNQKTDGVDIEVAYRVPQIDFIPGQTTFTAMGTTVRHLQTIDAVQTIENAGVTVPKWRWTVNLNHSVGPFSFNLQGRYYSTTKNSATLIGPEDPGYNPASPLSTNKNRFPQYVIFNLEGRYQIRGGDTPFEVYALIDNLLDKNPPFGSIGLGPQGGGGNAGGAAYYDVVGRDFKVGFRMSY